MWKEVPNSQMICLEKKKKNLIAYAIEGMRPSGEKEGRCCIMNTKTGEVVKMFSGLKNLHEACSVAEIEMKVYRVFVDED